MSTYVKYLSYTKHLRLLFTPSRHIRSLEERHQATLLLKLLFHAIIFTPLLSILHTVFGLAATSLLKVFLILVGWTVLYFLARSRYYRSALYLSFLFGSLVILLSYLNEDGNTSILFYYIPLVALSAALLPPAQVIIIGASHLIIIAALDHTATSAHDLSLLKVVLLLTGVTSLITAKHLRESYSIYDKELAYYDHHFQMLIRDTFDGLVVVRDGQIESADRNFAKLVQVSTKELEKKDIREFLSDDFTSTGERSVGEEGDTNSIETLLKTKGGRILHVEVWQTQLQQGHRQILAVRDITARKEKEAELRRQALYDDLTGLPNRRHLMQILPLYYQSESPSSHPILLFIDLDDFKKVNDTAGHAIGDQMLRQVAERLRSSVRASDFVTRYAGDEFIVICHVPKGETIALIERIRQVLQRPYTIEEQIFPLTVSIGVVRDIMEFQNAHELIRYADEMMYQAKHAGKAQVVYASKKHKDA